MSFNDDPPYDDEQESLGPVSPGGRVVIQPERAVRQSRPSAEDLLIRVADLIEGARPMPLSSSAMINKEEVLDLLHEAIEHFPDELREARWLLKERSEFLAKVRVDGDEILEAARARAERMVQRTEVVKSAEHRARRILEGAESEARRMRHECEDFCDQKLASFEIVLERTLKLVGSGRDKLQATSLARPEPTPGPEANDSGFFDQDQ